MKSYLPWTLLLLLAWVLAACQPAADEMPMMEMPPANVVVSEAQVRPLEHRRQYAARVLGTAEVDVRARVPGIVQSLNYDEGDYVEQGQLLFVIDPEPYEIALAAAQAELQAADATLQQAQREWERASNLFAADALSMAARDQARAALDTATAHQQRANSLIDEAQRNLSYTRVTAPASGFTGLQSMTVGNLLEAGTLLTRITNSDSVRVQFALPERDALQREQTVRQSAAETDIRYTQVKLIDSNGETYAHSGTLNFIDNRVDPHTGTVQMQAVFPNPQGHLKPGQFVRAELVLEVFDDVVVVPPEAIAQGRSGLHVFVLDNNTAAQRSVSTGPLIDGWQVIRNGLQAGEPVISAGLVMLQDGAEVIVNNSSDQQGS